MASMTTILDLGDLGAREVVVTYSPGEAGIRIDNVFTLGMDIAPWLTNEAEDALIDICAADLAGEQHAARDAHFEEKRERMAGSMTQFDIQKMQDNIDSFSSKAFDYCVAAVSISAVLVMALITFEVLIK